MDRPRIDVFSDASQREIRYTGAYMIGDEGPYGFRLEDCESSTEAELRTAAYATWEARHRYPAAKLVVHIDVFPITPLLVRRNVYGGSELANALEACEADILTDANDYPQHRRCHLYARRLARLRQQNEPEQLQKKTFETVRTVVEVLSVHEQVSQLRLAQESGLALNIVQKALRYLETQKAVECQRRDGPLGCDLRLVLWSKGQRFQRVASGFLEEVA